MKDRIAYNASDAIDYRDHHRKNLRVRLSTWRERGLAAAGLKHFTPIHALLDLASGTGRFWPVARTMAQQAFAMDNSEAMLRVARQEVPVPLPLVVGNAFQMPFSDNRFDAVLCLRFLHHFSYADDRFSALQELNRIVSKGVVLSVWTDAGRAGRRRLARQSGSVYEKGFGRRVCLPATVLEAEYQAAGFHIVWKRDLLPGVSLWRFYALEKV